jgi:NhaP-type Na+/H+ or K+/H+ antiporter
MESLIVVVVGLLVIAAATRIGPRLGLAAPLLLVLIGIGVSFLPFMPRITIEPEWILAGVLPPLLYSASISMPAMNFRREFAAISGLSIVLVLVSALLLGVLFVWAIPGLGFGWAVALGAIVSPTDAVATSIVKKTGVSPRVVAILEGESLLNDATALVLLRTAIASVAAAFSLWGALGDFAYAVAVAVVIGIVVGRLNLFVRARVSDPTVNTVISFTVPFVAAIPAELLGASGLVAAVVAGVITGRLAPRKLSPQHRLSDSQNWRTVELVLESAVFLTMGLQFAGLIARVHTDHAGVVSALGVAALALVVTIGIRTGYVSWLVRTLAIRARRSATMKPRIEQMQKALDDPQQPKIEPPRRGPGRQRIPTAADVVRMGTRLRRSIADLDYFLEAPLGWRDGTVIVWAGMRGAVTVAAAQTLPPTTPFRSLLILVAFFVAALSLLVQGGSLAPVVSWIAPAKAGPAVDQAGRVRLLTLLDTAGAEATATAPDDLSQKERAILSIRARREVLLDARDDGTFDADTLEYALTALDAEQISLELQGGPQG